MKIAFILLVTVHALIHLLGFVKGFDLAPIPMMKGHIGRGEGLLWLCASLALLLCIGGFMFEQRWWWVVGLIALFISQALIVMNWRDAKFGTIANATLIFPLVVSIANALPGSYVNRYNREVQDGYNRTAEMPLLTEHDLAGLPAPVQQYLRYTGSVGQPKIQNCRVELEGGIRSKMTDPFMKLRVNQSNFFDHPTRAFYMVATRWGIPVCGLHLFKDGRATMEVRLAALFKIVNGSGEKMTKSETVTMLNDMCILAPATLADKSIQWEPVDANTAIAHYSNAGITVSATLYFNNKGELTNFTSDDRYMSADGKNFINYRWSTPVSDYKNFRGRKIATYGEAIWSTPEGPFCYGKFRTLNIDYNCRGRPD